MFGDDFALRAAAQMTQLRPSNEHYMSKVRSTLKQIMRDWSAEGIVDPLVAEFNSFNKFKL